MCSPTQTFLPSLYTSFFPADIASLESKIHFELISSAYSNQCYIILSCESLYHILARHTQSINEFSLKDNNIDNKKYELECTHFDGLHGLRKYHTNILLKLAIAGKIHIRAYLVLTDYL